MSADNRGPAGDRKQVRGNRSAQAMLGRRGRDLVDETLARSTHENRQTESFELGKPRDHGETLVRRLAEADTGIEHYIFAGNTRRGRDSKRAVEEVGDIPHDVDGRIGRVA